MKPLLVIFTFIAAGCAGAGSVEPTKSETSPPSIQSTRPPASALLRSAPAQTAPSPTSAWPAAWEMAICDARDLLAPASDLDSGEARTAIDQAFTLIDAAPSWAPGEQARTHLRKTFELYSDAELYATTFDDRTKAILLLADALDELQLHSEALEAVSAATGFPSYCGGG